MLMVGLVICASNHIQYLIPLRRMLVLNNLMINYHIQTSGPLRPSMSTQESKDLVELKENVACGIVCIIVMHGG